MNALPTYKVSPATLSALEDIDNSRATDYPDEGVSVLVTDCARFVAPLRAVA